MSVSVEQMCKREYGTMIHSVSGQLVPTVASFYRNKSCLETLHHFSIFLYTRVLYTDQPTSYFSFLLTDAQDTRN